MEHDFSWHNPPKVIFGTGKVTFLSQEVKQLGASKVLILTDAGIVKAGIADKVKQCLEDHSEFDVFSDFDSEPSVEMVETCAELVRVKGYDLLIGLGGGSPIDIAKLAAVLCKQSKPLSDMWGIDNVPLPGIPTIMIPTTAGTGSEVTPIAIITDPSDVLKKGVVSKHLFTQVALCDPELTICLPPSLTACTGMDALTHAIEAYISNNAYLLTDLLALEAIAKISESLRIAFANGSNIKAREGMMLGSLLAGMAFSSAGVAAVHALTYPLGARFGIGHGAANGLLLPHVMEASMIGAMDRMAKLTIPLNINESFSTTRQAAMSVIGFIQELIVDIEIPSRLRDLGISEDALSDLARSAAGVTRLLGNNPRKLDEVQILEVYRKAY